MEETKLDSWSVRASFAPSPAWLLQVSYGEINEPEELHLGEDEHRTTASAPYNNGRGFSAMAAYSAKDRVTGPTLTAWLAEATWDLTQPHTIFGRFEHVDTDALFPDHSRALHAPKFLVRQPQLGSDYRQSSAELWFGQEGGRSCSSC